MDCFSTATAPERRNLTGKNRVWDFFPLSNETHPANRRQPAQPRRKIAPTAMKPASGIPYWPSRDPIAESGGMNLYGFLSNNPVESIDPVGKANLSAGKTTTENFDRNAWYDPRPFAILKRQALDANAITTIEYDVKATCICNDEGKPQAYWILDHYDIKIIAHVRLLPPASYGSKDARDSAVNDEDDHVKDYKKWTDLPATKDEAEKVEKERKSIKAGNKFYTKLYAKQKKDPKSECEKAARDAFPKDREFGVYADKVIKQTILNYDTDGIKPHRHQWPRKVSY